MHWAFAQSLLTITVGRSDQSGAVRPKILHIQPQSLGFESLHYHTYYTGISSMENILEWGDKSGPHRKTLKKGKELQNLTTNYCVQHLCQVLTLSL